MEWGRFQNTEQQDKIQNIMQNLGIETRSDNTKGADILQQSVENPDMSRIMPMNPK